MKKYAKLIITLGLAGGIMLAGCQKNETAEAEPTATGADTGSRGNTGTDCHGCRRWNPDRRSDS